MKRIETPRRANQTRAGQAASLRRLGPALLAIAAPALGGIATEIGPAPITSGPYVGRVSAIVCSPTDANKYFAAGADGGIWRTFDGGLSWEPLTDRLPTTAIGALAIDPSDENVIYAGTGEANYANHSRYGLGLYRSADGGDTWTLLGDGEFAGRTISRVLVSPADPQLLYAAIGRAGGFPELAAAKNHPDALGPIGVFRSFDAGATWEHLTNGLPAEAATDLAMDPTDSATLFAGIGRIFGSADNGIYRSTDGGTSWSKLSSGLPTGTLGRISLAIAPSDPLRVYALITNPSDPVGGGASTRGGYRSDDGGDTWTLRSPGSMQATYGWYLSVVSVSPSSADTVLMGGLDLRRSTSGGTTWTTVTPPHVDIHALAWDASGRLLCGNDGGVHRSTNNGTSWSALNEGLGTIQFYAGISTHPDDELIFFGGTQDNGTNRRNAAGDNWSNVLGGDGGWTQLDVTNPSRVFAELQGTSNLYRSTNGGSGFSFVGSGISAGDRNCFLPPYLIAPDDPNRMLFATQRIWRSTNGGSNWSALSGDLTGGTGAIRALAIAPSDGNVVYAATNEGRFLRSDDGGANFTLLVTGNPGWPRVTREIFVHPDEPLTVYRAVAAFGFDQVVRSTDGGATWTGQDGDLPDVPVNVVAVDVRFTPAVLYAGSDAGLYRSLNDGANWTLFGDGLPNAAVIDLRLEEARDRLVVATQGRGAWLVTGLIPADLDGDGDVDLSDLGELLANFPCADGDCPGDVDGDGDTDLSDLGVLLSEYGITP